MAWKILAKDHVKNNNNHFKHFKGFGKFGSYLTHYHMGSVEMLRSVLSSNRGKEVILRYEGAKHKKWKKQKYFEPDKIFMPREDKLKIPKTNSLNSLLEGLHPDNITIEIPSEKKIYEIQKICLGNNCISELRLHDKYIKHLGIVNGKPQHFLQLY